jgi:hypothetical protein
MTSKIVVSKEGRWKVGGKLGFAKRYQNAMMNVSYRSTKRNNQNETLNLTQIKLQQSQISFNELLIEREIGEGSYGKVCVGKWNGSQVAIKFCRNKGKLDEFMQEVRLIMYV